MEIRDATGFLVLGEYGLYGGSCCGTMEPFCGSALVAIPPGATHLALSAGPAGVGPVLCVRPAVTHATPTVGTLHAAFH